MGSKTTIAIARGSRKTLGRIKNILELRYNRFVDMDEVVRFLLDNIPDDLKKQIRPS